jgi:hypothetical protein
MPAKRKTTPRKKYMRSAQRKAPKPHWAWKALVLLNIFVLLPTVLFFIWLAYQNDHSAGEPEVVAAILWPFFFVALLTFLANIPALMVYSYRNYKAYQLSKDQSSLKRAILSLAVLIVILFYSFIGGAAH